MWTSLGEHFQLTHWSHRSPQPGPVAAELELCAFWSFLLPDKAETWTDLGGAEGRKGRPGRC